MNGWIGDAINYGPHRDGQHPGGPSPSREELSEDLRLMQKHWHLLRVYQAAGVSEDLVSLIETPLQNAMLLTASIGSAST